LSRSDNQNDPSDNQKSGDKQNPCEVRESTRSSLRYRPPLSHSECRSVLIQIVAQQCQLERRWVIVSLQLNAFRKLYSIFI
jgi:hypothetical protein